MLKISIILSVHLSFKILIIMILFQKNENQMLYIDYEEYELKPIQIKLLPQSITIFCPEFNR